MKTTNQLKIAIVFMLFLFGTSIFAQMEEKRPEYITVTTMHWNMDMKDFKMEEWKAVEKEYLDKVTMNNEHVLGASFHLHQFTADNTELLYVQSYATWEDIDKAGKKNTELEEKAWSDKNARKAAADKRNAYYANTHSDEIYATLPGAKFMKEKPTKDMTLYVRKSHLAFPKDGTLDEVKKLRKERIEAVVQKNEFIKAYYPSMHAWGQDKTEFIEAYIVDSMADLDKMLDRNIELAKEAWPDENKRKARGEKMRKYFTGVHGDYIYTSVAGLSK